MAAQYQQQQQQQQPDLGFYRQPQWSVDNKPTGAEEDEMSLLDEKILESTTLAEISTDHDLPNPTLDQSNGAFSPRTDMWHNPPHHAGFHHSRQQAHASMPMIDTGRAHFAEMEATPDGTYAHHPSWPGSAMSGTSTPTPIFGHPGHGFHQMAYQGGNVNFSRMPYPTDPFSATPMSPQSSQGGWMSATSSDGTEPRSRPVESPGYRAASPASHIRRDGIRKKNARFEIPAERNLANIDSLILQTADEQEKKELKQQKRLLRNRQAALDSRQRKKLHTEKLEQEKKEFNQHLNDLQDEVRQLRDALQQATEVRVHQQQEYEHYIQTISFQRDEAIRSKTLETAELRKMNNILKDHIRDYERQAASGHDIQNPTSFSNEFPSFGELDMEENSWNNDFSLINNNGFNNDPMENSELSPAAPQPTHSAATESKPDTPFSWNAFYMCLLFGAFIASNSSTNSKPAVPALSEEYRAESANVLKAVLTSGPGEARSLLPPAPPRIVTPDAGSGDPSTISGPEMARITSLPADNLGALHKSLITPSRRQRETAAFSLSAASYDHLTNPDTFLSGPDGADETFEAKPSRLQTAFNAMQESRQDVDKVINRSANERSVMWERVPEKVLRDFRRMVEDAEMNK